MDDEAKATQVAEFAACDRQTAHRLLAQHHGDVEAAINAVLMGGAELVGDGGMSNSNTLDAGSQSIAPYQGDLSQPQPQPAPGVSQQAQTHSQEQAQAQGPVAGPRPEGQFGPMASFDEAWAQQQNWNSGAPPSVPERTSKKRSTPVDLTGDDEDEDMKRALQASIESETDRQKRHQTYPGFDGAGTGAAGMGASHGPHPLRTANDEDEALTRAIAASMEQSTSALGHDGQAAGGIDIESLEPSRIRKRDELAAVTPPTRVLRHFALMLQALFASSHFCQALLALDAQEVRLLEPDAQPEPMADFWRGASPNDRRAVTHDMWASLGLGEASDDVRQSYEVVMRLTTLLRFLLWSNRPLCVADDMLSYVQGAGFAYVMNSENRPADQIASCYISNLVEQIKGLAGWNKDADAKAPTDEHLRGCLFSTTAIAVQPRGTESPKSKRTASNFYDNAILHMVHDRVSTTVTKGLYATLSEEKALFDRVADTLVFHVDHADQLSAVGDADAYIPFTVEERIYMDPFMYEKRNGARLGVDSDEVKARTKRIEALKKYHKKLSWHDGRDSRGALRESIRYFEELAIVDRLPSDAVGSGGNGDGDAGDDDELRRQQVKEAGPMLRRIEAALHAELKQTDEAIRAEETAIETERARTTQQFEEQCARVENRTMAYRLCGMLVQHAGTTEAWGYFLHAGRWWTVCDGRATRLPLDGDEREGQGEDGGAAIVEAHRRDKGGEVYMLVYESESAKTGGVDCKAKDKRPVQGTEKEEDNKEEKDEGLAKEPGIGSSSEEEDVVDVATRMEREREGGPSRLFSLIEADNEGRAATAQAAAGDVGQARADTLPGELEAGADEPGNSLRSTTM
ncbi:hypothetical protein FA10DRAFT_269617 [Acaromyces ingoldii]|uniref:USP domain-containing protein n=1 Tax=Acaromyces ingoldii TaxID=215250 RepID=A0A316YDS6_9BASI|nr:hypothetical protein FA10DRAFT_269617 [Acaromyces ingoldii]PWN87004.1 hypothetical protein FA10DRAFT_269617 [Acaromyces ingoldii]